MPSRTQLYRNAKSISQRHNIPLSLHYPRGSAQQWENEFNRIRDIVSERKEQKLRENKQQEKRQIANAIMRWRNTEMKTGLTLKPKFISKKETLRIIRGKTNDIRIVLNIGDSNYTLNTNTYLRLKNMLDGVETKQNTESDQDFKARFETSDTITINYVRTIRAERKSGGFFPYISKHNFDLTRQQIFNDTENFNSKVEENCLIHALRMSEMKEKYIKKIKQLCLTRVIPQNKLKKICDLIGVRIAIKSKNGKTKYYGNKKAFRINIGLLAGHYFLIEKINITKYAFLNNLEKKDWNVINASGIRKNNKYNIDTFQAVEMLLNNPDFIQDFDITKEILETSYSNKIKDFKTLPKITEKEYKKIFNQKSKSPDKRKVLYFDFETITEGKIHKPFMCHYYDQENPDITYEFLGENCGLKMLQSLKSDTLLYAHNAGYDYRFLLKYLKISKILNPNNSFMNCKGIFNKFKIEIRDSYKMISKPLRDFGKCFNLEQAKEIMPYSLQTEKNIKSRFISASDCAKAQELINSEDYKLFMDNCHKWSCIEDEHIDIIKYASIYCRIDCVVLAQGMEIFRGWMLKATKLDIYNILTIPSLAHKYMVNKGCYKGVCEISSVARSFIQKCLVGGRVMLAENKKVIRRGRIADFDGVSLYPSAMDRLGDLGGFLKGTPKVWNPKINLDKVDGYFLQVEITDLKYDQRFPLASKIENGIRTFTNDIIGQKLFIDKIALEDLVEFQGVKYKIIKGYYFNEGRNPKIKEVINYLFNERLKKKEQKNPIQEVYKLIMNAVYGKTLMKPVEKEQVIINGTEKMEKYIDFNFSMIDSFHKIHDSDKYIIKKLKSIDNHFNICHVGIEILSMSKRIMNEVMCLADDNYIELFYQDTDSLHMFQNDIMELSNLYREKYNRELVGKSLGQFHDDFSLKGCDKPYSSLFIGLGKKCYMDRLHGTDKEGKKHKDFHLRMKGVPNSTLKYEAAKKFNGSFSKMYKHLFKGEKVEFDLLQGGDKVRFKKYNNLSIGSIAEFKRNLKF